MKLQQKYFLSYLFFITLFSAFLIVVLSIFYYDQAQNELRNSSEKTFSQTVDLLNYQFRQYMYTSYLINNSNEFINAQTVPAEELYDSVGVQFREAAAMHDVVTRSLLPFTDVQMRLYVDDSFHKVINHTFFENITYLEQYPWYEEFISDQSLTSWQPTVQTEKYSSEEFSALSLFRKVNTTPSRNWVTELYIPQEHLQKTLENADPTGEGMVFLQAEDHTLLSCTNETLYEVFFQAAAGSFYRGRMEWTNITINGRKYWYYSQPLSSTGWFLTSLFPSDITGVSPSVLMNSALLTLIAIFVISLIAAKLFTQSFCHRLLLLEEKMGQMCAGDLDVRVEVQGKDEVSRLFQSFNHMTAEMKQLVQRQHEDGIRLKNAELNALLAQINPHFLYNTLELINWKAMENDCFEIEEIAKKLARFYRLTLGNGHSMVSLQDELEHIAHYLSIQNFRFAQEIQLMTDVPDECLAISVPRLTLQPLVENSVLHGFLPKEETFENRNIICLTAEKTGDTLIITLTDNGIGMPGEILDKILSEDHAESGNHFGVMNIHQRLQILYGKEYGLSYSAAPGQGVCVLIRMKIE